MYTGALRFTTQMSYILSSSLFSNSQVLLTIFQNCSAGNNGGGFYQTFHPSTAPEYTPAYTFSLENCTFDNCTAGGAGGGCLVSDQTTGFPTVAVTLPEVIAVNCKAKQGAVILARDMKSVSIEKSSFTSCESSDSGTIRVNHLVSSSIKTSNFTDCVSTGEEGGGGIVIDTEDSSVIDECQFVDLNSKGPGTAVQVSEVATVTVTNSTFSGCSYSKNGGAIWTSGITTTLTLKTSKITNCESKGSGRGVAFVLTAESVALNLEMGSVAFGTVAEGSENTCEGLAMMSDGIAFTRSQRLSAAFAENTTVYTARCSVLVHFNHSSNGALTIDSENGLDEERCGESTVPCETLTRGVGGIATGYVSAKTGGSISVASGQLNLVKIEFSQRDILLVHQDLVADAAFKMCSSDGSGGAVFVWCGSAAAHLSFRQV
ncbi:hypothetical protein BLNAU_9753 [Blattamonas nauphoetae]|uniref:Right handed beta helix domain-containing protein n=1 Tax=Blattamonas nauphoetae TaxID=2049346 RepID=A0ABQ9XV56_9EUKA|nr:hypothetical protein BLNAU_9753 [Blattamonas nauphoetae]